MTETVLVALLALVGTLSGSYMSNRKTTALLDYRMQRLEERVNKHNDVIERTYKLEKQEEIIEEKIRVANHRIDDLEQYHKGGQ